MHVAENGAELLKKKSSNIVESLSGAMVSLLSERGRERLANSPVDFCSEQHGVTDFRGEVTLTYFHIMHVADRSK